MSTNWPAWLPLRGDLQPLSPYGAPQIPADALLNTNENPYPPSEELIEAITKAVASVAGTLNRYPDRDATGLRSLLAIFINELSDTKFSAENIWAANGSNEVIQSIFLAFGKGAALGFTPSYSMHPIIAQITGTKWIHGKRNPDLTFNLPEAIQEVEKHEPTLTFITTPNNPTGDCIPLADIVSLAHVVARFNGLLVVDEAYAEFSQEKSAVTLIATLPNIIVIRTMSKAFAFAGARLGYLVANSHVKDAMMLVRLPYHLSALTQAAATVAINFRSQLLSNIARLVDSREIMSKKLKALGLDAIPSSANFILFTGFAPSAPQLWQELLDRGVLIRDVGLFGYLRVTIGTETENTAFISALTEALKSGEKK